MSDTGQLGPNYWTERFAKAEHDADEARALLRMFAALADDAGGAEPLLVQWVAERVKAWSDAAFKKDAALPAFGVKRPRNASTSSIDAQTRRQRALALVLVRNSIDRLPFHFNRNGTDTVFEAVAREIGLSADYVRDEYKVFSRKLRDGSATVAEWMPVLLNVPPEHRARALKLKSPSTKESSKK